MGNVVVLDERRSGCRPLPTCVTLRSAHVAQHDTLCLELENGTVT